MNAKQQREWEDDVTQPCAFPEPLAEVLTRENRELRAEVERLRGARDMCDLDLLARAERAEAELAEATMAAQNLRDELQGAQERLRRVRELADEWLTDTGDHLGRPRSWWQEQSYGNELRAALDAEP